MKSEAMAELFYDQCAGSTSGHMANVPNNPVLFSLVSCAADGKPDNCRAASKKNFALMLREMADHLENADQF